MTQTEPSFLPISLRTGLLFGTVMIIIGLIYSMAGLQSNLFASMLLMVVNIVVYLLAAFRSSKAHRDIDLGGHITFGRAFITGFVAVLIATIIGTLFNIIYVNYIDPGSIDAAVDGARDMMERFGADEDAIDQAMEDARNRMSNPMSLIIQGILGGAVMGAIAAVIAAAINKRAPEAQV